MLLSGEGKGSGEGRRSTSFINELAETFQLLYRHSFVKVRRCRLEYPVIVPDGAGPGSKIRVKNPQTGADVNVIVPAGITAGMTFLVPLKPAADENI